MSKSKSKPGREKKNPKASKAPRPRTEIRKITPPVPTAKEVKDREDAQKADNARVRHAVTGSSFLADSNTTGVTILSGKKLPLPKRPEILSKHKR